MSELYYLEPVPPADSIGTQSDETITSGGTSSQSTQKFIEQPELVRRVETLEKYISDLRENVVITDSDASLKSLTIKDRLTAYWGRIGGWLIENGVLSTPKIQIDSNNERIRSTNYQAGTSGFTIQSDLVEAENLIARGTMRGSIFAYDVVSAVGGQLMVANADILSEDMTTLDDCKVKIKGDTSFSVNDILVMRGVATSGIQEEWFRVTTVSGSTLTVTRDLAGLFSANSNPAWKAGTPVVKQGSSDGASTYSGGWLRLFGEGTNSPYYSVFQRTGVAYNAYTEVARLGNLNGYLDYASNLFGIAIGEATKYLKYDPTNGLRISGDIQVVSYLTAGIALTAGQAVAIYTDGKVYSTDARVSAMATGFIGFCLTNTSLNGTAPILVTGKYDGLSGLSAGVNYYLSNASTDTQDQTADGTGLAYVSNGEDHWQSFTTGNGVVNLSSFKLNVRQISGGGSTCGVLIKEGEGTGGTTIYSGTATFGATGWITNYLSAPIAVSANTKYTLVLSAGDSNLQFYESQDSGYSNGVSDLGTNHDMDFFTYYSGGGRGAVSTSAGTVSKKVGLALSSTNLLILNT